MPYMRRSTLPAAAFDRPDRRVIVPPNAPRAMRAALGGTGLVLAKVVAKAVGPIAEAERRVAPLTFHGFYGGQIRTLQKLPGRTQTTPAAPLVSSMPGYSGSGNGGSTFNSSATPPPTSQVGAGGACNYSRMGCATPGQTKPLPLPKTPSPSPGPNLQIGTGIGDPNQVAIATSSPPSYLTGPVYPDPGVITGAAAPGMLDGAIAWVQANPLLAAGGAFGAYLLFFRKP